MADLEKALRNLKVLVMRLEVYHGQIDIGWTPKSNQVDPDYRSCATTLAPTEVETQLRRLVNDLFPTVA